jgi:mannitol/fructose-specific phosphotransferase system IIA component (Ntr-type)
MAARLSDGLAVAPVIVDKPWRSFEEAVGGLVRELVAAGHLSEVLAEPAAHAVLDREAMASTALVEIGVSIPHARLGGVGGIVAALAVSPTAVYLLAEVPITIMVLVISSPALSGEHLNFLSTLSMLLQSDTTRRELQVAETPADVIDYLRHHGRLR